MSIHVISDKSKEARRKEQKRQATTSSSIALLAMVLIMLVLSLFLLAPNQKEEMVIISYAYEQVDEKEDKKTPKETVKKKPSPPSGSMSKVITAVATTDITVPVPEVDAVAPSFEFGSGDDFGSGWGGGGGGGGGSGGGFASFYNTKTKADRVAYVIDYSASMGGQRDHLMRAELARSVGALKGKIEYQLIFFAGPAWVAGDEVNGGKQTAIIASDGGKEYEWFSNGGPHAFNPKSKGDIQKPKWLKASKSQINKSMDHIQETPLVWGTTWEPAIDMALRMSPKPNVIFFMTDGSCGGNMVQIGADIGRKAKSKGVIINTVAMMQPQTKEAMLKMAEISGGTFTMIQSDGRPYDKDGRPVKMKD